jgi:hypothetical protein
MADPKLQIAVNEKHPDGTHHLLALRTKTGEPQFVLSEADAERIALLLPAACERQGAGGLGQRFLTWLENEGKVPTDPPSADEERAAAAEARMRRLKELDDGEQDLAPQREGNGA